MRTTAQPYEELLRDLRYEGFWEGKIPCWEMLRCPTAVRAECPAPKFPQLPCWEIEGTYAKLALLSSGEVSGTDLGVCRACRVYHRWGHDQPLVLRLFGKGLDQRPEALAKLGWPCVKSNQGGARNEG